MYMYMYVYVYIYIYIYYYYYIYIYIYIKRRGVLLTEILLPRIARQGTPCRTSITGYARTTRIQKFELDVGFQPYHAVSFHNFKSQNFKSSVSNPKSKYVAYLSVLSQISNCQSLGKNKHDILKTDRAPFRDLVLTVAAANF